MKKAKVQAYADNNGIEPIIETIKTIKSLEIDIQIIQAERLELKRRQAAKRVQEWRLKKAIALIKEAHGDSHLQEEMLIKHRKNNRRSK